MGHYKPPNLTQIFLGGTSNLRIKSDPRFYFVDCSETNELINHPVLYHAIIQIAQD